GPRPDGLTVQAQLLFRYQYSNHLGSACLELDAQAEIISYEEYHPYGTSAHRAVKSGIEAPPKRYRYTGMERDEESGLNYHTERYLACWLGRWITCDPLGITDHPNQYLFARDNPLVNTDSSGRQPVKFEQDDAGSDARQPDGGTADAGAPDAGASTGGAKAVIWK